MPDCRLRRILCVITNILQAGGLGAAVQITHTAIVMSKKKYNAQ